MILGDIVKQYRTEHNISMSDFAKMSGLSKGYISMLEKNYNPATKKSITPSLETIKHIAHTIGIDINMLLEQLDDEQQISLDNTSLPPNAIPVGEQGKIPIIGNVSAGNGVLAYDDILGYEFADIRYCDENHFYLRVSGDSMMPKIEDGDLVLVHKQDSVDSGNYAVVVVDEEDGCIKIVKYGKDWIELHSINPYYPIREFKGRNVLRIRVIGKVIEIKRKL